MRLKFCLNIERLSKNWFFVGIRWLYYYLATKFSWIGGKDFLNEKKIGDKVKEMKEEKEDPRSRMWKQVIKENDREEKKNEIEDLGKKTDGIEKQVVRITSKIETAMKKLEEIDNDAKREHEKRKVDLENMMTSFERTIDKRKEQETLDRTMEVNRTIEFMENLGN